MHSLKENFIEDLGHSSDSDDCIGIITQMNKVDSVFETVVSNDEYILNISATSESEPCVAVALSDGKIQMFKLSSETFAAITTVKQYEDKIIDCSFVNGDYNLLSIGFRNGRIMLWDMRLPEKSIINFLDTTITNGNTKLFNCYDVSCNGTIFSAGTDLFEGDAYLLFWDIRNCKLLGGYWESHVDDITQVKFHPEDKDKLISGSTDGLINIYDLSHQCEKDALLNSLNTQSSVDQLQWFDENLESKISCITHTFGLQLWNMEGAEPYKHLNRTDITRKMKKKHDKYTYLTKVHNSEDSLLVLAGSNYKGGECLHGLPMKFGQAEYVYDFNCNKQRVRCSWLNSHKNILLTGGEQGIINIWSGM